MKKIECFLLGLMVFYLGYYFTAIIPGLGNQGMDVWMEALEGVRCSVLFLASIVSGSTYLIIKEMRKDKEK